MFCIKLSEMSKEDILTAMLTLANYRVDVEAFAEDEDDRETTYMIVKAKHDSSFMSPDTEDAENEERLAEMAFQMSHYQLNTLCCPICSDREDICGHLTFGGLI